MVGWHHQLNGHEFEQAMGDGEGKGSLACCSPRGHQDSDICPEALILKEIISEYSLKGLMLKLKVQYFGHLMRGADSLEKILMLERLRAGGEGDDRG